MADEQIFRDCIWRALIPAPMLEAPFEDLLAIFSSKNKLALPDRTGSGRLDSGSTGEGKIHYCERMSVSS